MHFYTSGAGGMPHWCHLNHPTSSSTTTNTTSGNQNQRGGPQMFAFMPQNPVSTAASFIPLFMGPRGSGCGGVGAQGPQCHYPRATSASSSSSTGQQQSRNSTSGCSGQQVPRFPPVPQSVIDDGMKLATGLLGEIFGQGRGQTNSTACGGSHHPCGRRQQQETPASGCRHSEQARCCKREAAAGCSTPPDARRAETTETKSADSIPGSSNDRETKTPKSILKKTKTGEGKQAAALPNNGEPAMWVHSLHGLRMFSPNEIAVKVKDGKVMVRARHEQSLGPGPCLSRMDHMQTVPLPENVEPHTLKCIMKPDGTLLLCGQCRLPEIQLEKKESAEKEEAGRQEALEDKSEKKQALEDKTEKREAIEDLSNPVQALTNIIHHFANQFGGLADEEDNDEHDDGHSNNEDRYDEEEESAAEVASQIESALADATHILPELLIKSLTELARKTTAEAAENSAGTTKTTAQKEEEKEKEGKDKEETDGGLDGQKEEDAEAENEMFNKEEKQEDESADQEPAQDPFIQMPDDDAEEEDANSLSTQSSVASDFEIVKEEENRHDGGDVDNEVEREVEQIMTAASETASSEHSPEDCDITPPIKRHDDITQYIVDVDEDKHPRTNTPEGQDSATDLGIATDSKNSDSNYGNITEHIVDTNEKRHPSHKKGPFHVELPVMGFSPRDMHISLSGRTLTIRAHRQAVLSDAPFTEGLERQIQLPEHLNTNTVRCQFQENGYLVITALPKEEKEDYQCQIPVELVSE